MKHRRRPYRTMQYSFDAPAADVVLRAQDGTQFRVFRQILVTASPFFHLMFSLPQPSSELASDIPVIDVSESADVLDALLRLVYPVVDPPLDTLDAVSDVLDAAMKYDMPAAIAVLRRLLVSTPYLDKAPTRVYAIACSHGLEEETRIASAYTLKVNVLDCPLHEDLRLITAYDYQRLLNLHRSRAEAAVKLLVVDEDVKCVQCSSGMYGTICPPRWWCSFEERARKELRSRPITDVVFSMEFLSQSATLTGCQRCTGSVLDSHEFLSDLKRRIDELPNTV